MSGRIAIVTGGGSGIGQGVARRFAADGTVVGIVDMNGEAAAAEAASIVAAGGKAAAAAADVTDRAQVDAAVAELTSVLGNPTILANCAGLVFHGAFLELSVETWNKALAINLTGTFNVCQAVLPSLVAAGWGRVVNISSSVVHSGAPFLTPYAAAKSGVVGLTKALALEFAGNGITVNTVAPSAVDTPMFRRAVDSGSVDIEKVEANIPIGRIAVPEDIAALVSFLVSDEASYVTGQLLGINGGVNT